MRYAVYTADSNPNIDIPLTHKPKRIVEQMIDRGDAVAVLGSSGKLRGIHLVNRIKDQAFGTTGKAGISARESDLHAGQDGSNLETPAVRAHQKIKAWPYVGDTKAVRVGIRVL